MTDGVPITPGRAEIVDLYAEALARLRRIVTGDMSGMSSRQAARKILEIQAHTALLRKRSAAWSMQYIPDAYRKGWEKDEKTLRRLMGDEYTGQFGKLNIEAARVVAEGSALDLNAAADALETTYTGYIRRIQVEGAKQAIARKIGGGIIEGASRQTVTKRLLEDLKERATDGMITVGKVTMQVTRYADLLARTVTRAAGTEGTLNRLKEAGLDLVIINTTGAVDFCRVYEGQIFSLSGRDSRFPVLTQRPPFHPNCTHSLSAFVPDFASPEEIEYGRQFRKEDNGKSASEMAQKYPQEKDDRRARMKGKK